MHLQLLRLLPSLLLALLLLARSIECILQRHWINTPYRPSTCSSIRLLLLLLLLFVALQHRLGGCGWCLEGHPT
jgi:hypothetical protein